MLDWQKERLPLQLSLHLHTTSRTEEMYYFPLPHVRTGTDRTEKWQLLGPHAPDFGPQVLWWFIPGSLCPRTVLCSRLPYPVYSKGVSSPLALTVCSCSCPKPVSSTLSPFPPVAPETTTAISSSQHCDCPQTHIGSHHSPAYNPALHGLFPTSGMTKRFYGSTPPKQAVEEIWETTSRLKRKHYDR